MTDLYLRSFFGGLLIGTAGVLFLLFQGRILGVSGIVAQADNPKNKWASLFIFGLIVGGLIIAILIPGSVSNTLNPSFFTLTAAGLLVGFGTRLGNGCTSGHGICGVSRLSPRSLLATGVFMLTGMATVYIMRHL